MPSDHDDLRRRALHQEKVGNYWATKTRLLIDEVDAERVARERAEQQLAAITAAAQAYEAHLEVCPWSDGECDEGDALLESLLDAVRALLDASTEEPCHCDPALPPHLASDFHAERDMPDSDPPCPT